MAGSGASHLLGAVTGMVSDCVRLGRSMRSWHRAALPVARAHASLPERSVEEEPTQVLRGRGQGGVRKASENRD